MTQAKSGFQQRVKTLVDVAGGMKPLARRLGVTDSAIKSWLRGSKPAESKLKNACRQSGIGIDWLKFGHGSTEAEIAKVSPRTHYEDHSDDPSPRFAEPSPSYNDEDNDGWRAITIILAARLNSKQIAEAMKEILDADDIDESVSKVASQILVAAQLPKLNR